MARKTWKVAKGLGLSPEEDRMLAAIAKSAGEEYRTRMIATLINQAAADTKKAEAPAELLADGEIKTVGIHYYVTRDEMNKLSDLCAYFRAGEKDVVRHLIRAYYDALPAEMPAEPTATQMPLPEPLSEAEAIAARIEAERMHDAGEFRAVLLKVLGRIADGLDALNESRGAGSAELGRITNQLKTLNNAVWNR